MAAFAPLIISGIGMMQQASAQREEAEAQRQKSNFDAAQMQRAAIADQAASQVAAEEERHKANMLTSRAIAVAAASGAGVTDPSVLSVISGISAQGDLNSRSRLFAGDTSAGGKLDQADQYRLEGDQAVRAGRTRAQATILNGVSSMASTYSQNKRMGVYG